jgi:rRNA processing protein Gar1
LNYLGKVTGLGYDGNILVRADFAPRHYQKVMDKGKRVVGKVSRIFGPVSSPYISIRPPKDHRPSLDIIGKDVYINHKKR